MISSHIAHRLIEESLAEVFRQKRDERIPIEHSVGRVLIKAVYADREHPPFNRVAMDGVGIAYRFAKTDDWFQLTGRLPAGVPWPQGEPSIGDAIEVMTGAALPSGWDTVIPWEHLESDGNRYRLLSGKSITRGMNVHHQGSDYHCDELLIPPRTRLSVPHLHILATVGFETVQVIAKPRIALIATGDELVPVSSIPEPHQIRRSNMAVIAGSLIKAGFAIQLNQHLPDDPQALRIGISLALKESEVLLISGAVSMGSKDDVPRVLESLGCACVFHRIAQKPGKPMWFGKSPQGGIIFALPGNPVASLVCFRRYVFDYLCNWGTRDPVPVLTYPVGESLSPHPSMTHFLPALLEVDDAGKTILVPRRGGGSGNFASLLPSHGFIELAAGDSILPMGAQISFFPWESI